MLEAVTADRPGPADTSRAASWLRWAMQLQSIADAGLEFGSDDFDRERYENVRRIAAELIAHHLVDGDVTTVGELFPVGHGYLTPKVDVRALVVDGAGQLLCVRNRESQRWSLPGGFADLGESPTESARREVLEETGYEVRPRRLLALMECDRHRRRALRWSFWQAVIACDLVSGTAQTSIETVEVGWFATDALPDLDERSPAMVVEVALAALADGSTHCD